MNYYVLQNDEIVLFDTDRSRLQTTLKFKPELAGQEIQETEKEIVLLNDKFVFADEHQEELNEKEELAQIDQEAQELETTLNELKSMYTQAQMIGDTETMEEISNTTKELLGLVEEPTEEVESSTESIEKPVAESTEEENTNGTEE